MPSILLLSRLRRLALATLLGTAVAAAAVHAAVPAAGDTIDMSVAVGKALSDALDLMAAGKLDEAAAALQALRAGGLNDYETSRVLQQLVNLDINRNDTAAALADSEALLATASLSAGERTSATLLLGKLYLQAEDWSRGIAALQQVNDSQGGTVMETLYLLGFGHYRTQQPAQAIGFLEQAVQVGGSQAGEPHYSLLGVLYVNAKDYPKAVAAYENLFAAVPAPTQAESYASTLAQLYVQTGDTAKARARLEQLITDFPGSARLGDYRSRLAALR